MSDTPRTDARKLDVGPGGLWISYCDMKGHAQILELELAALRAENERLRDEMADYDRGILRKFDDRAAESTDLFTWIQCLISERDRMRAAKEPT